VVNQTFQADDLAAAGIWNVAVELATEYAVAQDPA
jgi:hypothetical protein